MKYDNILQTVGRTPIVRINKLAPAGVNLFVKLESFNPLSSVKDRMALAVIEAAEKSGALKPGQTVIEATSGNTGIGLAMVCAQKGYPLVLVMAESFSIERRRLMRFLGAKVVLTPAALKGTGMIAKTIELVEAHGWFWTRQFENEANADMHSRTTALEILAGFEGERLDYWVTGYGTGGTLKGVSRVLRESSPHTRIIVSEADNAPVLASGIPQPHNADGSNASHPSFRPHPIQGTTTDFIPKLTQDAVDAKFIDAIIGVDGAVAMQRSRELARQEGIFVGISAGAAFAAALEIAKNAPKGANILAMMPDTGERYLSTPLFDSVQVEMDAEELEISRSTPSGQFEASAAAAPAQASSVQARPDAEATAFVEGAIRDHAVVLFALKWCEFTWSVRRMFAELGIDYFPVDLDTGDFQKADWGGRVRRALQAKSGAPTIPQIFVGGDFIGGASETLDAWRTGRLSAALSRAGVHVEAQPDDPSRFLPKWLQPRAAG
ncbi:MAG: pyridoxal-phosphate dependent enzyme [Proteobacteria bacterium]|nr:pyridoxal-phosphate dependent enzyme [Pseudomonadota bacterium]